jgi:motility quorum-sensing regulator/GCU-specific mRNA interferase toxin
MEKKKAHYDLNAIKAIVARDGIVRFTFTAIRGVEDMDNSMFYKSMTTHADHQSWQDVYIAPCPNGRTAYIKFTLQEGAVVIQFKEK